MRQTEVENKLLELERRVKALEEAKDNKLSEGDKQALEQILKEQDDDIREKAEDKKRVQGKRGRRTKVNDTR